MAATTHLRQARLEARLSKSQKQLFERAASLKGTTLSQFVIASAQDAAVRLIEEQHLIDLTRRDQEQLVEALLNPPAPNARLRAAVARHRRTVAKG